MKLVEMNWAPTDRQLKQFGVIALVALPALAWIWSRGNLTAVSISGGVGALLAGLGLLVPRSLKPIFIGLCVLCIPIGIVVGELAMLVIYFGLFLPMAILFRIMKRDSLKRKFDRQAETYWEPKGQPSGPASYYRQS
jgi:hypothetical protein